MHGNEFVAKDLAPDRVAEECASQRIGGILQVLFYALEDWFIANTGPLDPQPVILEIHLSSGAVVGHHEVRLSIVYGSTIRTLLETLQLPCRKPNLLRKRVRTVGAGFSERSLRGCYRGECSGHESGERSRDGAFFDDHAIVELGTLPHIDNSRDAGANRLLKWRLSTAIADTADDALRVVGKTQHIA